MNRFRILASLFALGNVVSAGELRFYVTAGKPVDPSQPPGIYTGTLDDQTGKLSPLTPATTVSKANFLAFSPDRKFLYAASDNQGGSVTAFRVNSDHSLTLLNEQVADKGTCHVSVDATGRNVFAANYNAGNIAAFRTQDDGSLGARTAFVPFTGTGPDAKRQAKPHAHAIYADAANRVVYACDLGTDSVWQFNLDAASGTLTPHRQGAAKVPPGGGARHLAFHPNGKFAYVNSEMGLSVTAFAVAADGALTGMQTLPTLPPGADPKGASTSEIVCHPSGRWLYVSNRGHDSLTVFAITAAGPLQWVENVSAQVKVPRSFAMDAAGRWLITAGQGDNRIAVLKLDPASGRLRATDSTATIGAPACVAFAP